MQNLHKKFYQQLLPNLIRRVDLTNFAQFDAFHRMAIQTMQAIIWKGLTVHTISPATGSTWQDLQFQFGGGETADNDL